MKQYEAIKNERFASFADLARAMHAADVKAARNLRQTSAARKANAARKGVK